MYIFYRYSNKNMENSKEFKIISDIFSDSKAEFYNIDQGASVLQGMK